MNEEIYKTPGSNLTNEENRAPPFGKKLRGSVISILTIWIYFGLNKVVRQFTETFAAFGADLPILTTITIKITFIYKGLGIFSTAMFILWIYSMVAEKKEKLVYKLIKINFIVSLVILLLVMFCMYLPILQLGKVV